MNKYMIKKGAAALVVMTGTVCGVCAQETLTVSQLNVVDANNANMVQLNSQGNVSAKGVFLTPNVVGYYSATLGLSFNTTENMWSIETYKQKMQGPNDPMAFFINSETFVGSDMTVKGNFTGEGEMTVKDVLECKSNLYARGNAFISDDADVGGNLNVGRGNFYVSSQGTVDLHDQLTISETVGGGPVKNLIFSLNKNGWNMSTVYGVPDASNNYQGLSPLVFCAANYTFQEGNMTVDGTITCKDKMKVVEVETGKLKADDVTVNMNNAADYVFDENYDLKSLGEVEAYVKANKHLPGIPSASQMKEEGMNVSEMSNLLLEKIEELTLHVIRLEKENQELKSEMKAMKSGK